MQVFDSQRKPVKPANLSHFSQPNLQLTSRGDKFEREADHIADRIVRMPTSTLRSPNASGQSYQANQVTQSQTGRPLVQTKRTFSGGEDTVNARPMIDGVIRSPGSPLDTTIRQSMESRFNHDFSQIRIHADSSAANAAKSINAKAFTVGNHVAFGRGYFNPGTPTGERLMAHELTHTLQQNNTNYSGPAVIQREEESSTKADSKSSVTLKDVVPFEKGDRITLNHIVDSAVIEAIKLAARLSDKLDIKDVEEASALLPDLVKRTGTIKILTDDRAVLTIDKKAAADTKSVTEKKQSKQGLIDLTGDFTIELTRDAKSKTMSVFVFKGQGKDKELLGKKDKINISRTSEGVKLSADADGTAIGASVTTDKAGNDLTVALSNPVEVKALSISRLPKARKGSVVEQEAISKAANRAGESRAFKRFRLSSEVGANLPSSGGAAALLGAAFQVNFRPVKSASLFFHVPLEAHILYVPKASVLAAINTGATLSLEQVAPINFRIIAGVGGGTTADKSTGKNRRLLGPTVGGGINIKVEETVTVGIRYQHLINLVGDKVDARVLSAGVSKRF